MCRHGVWQAGGIPITMENTPAYVKAMSLLAISDMSERKMREKLISKGFSDDETADAIDRLKSNGYLRDERLMENLVAYYSKRKYFGRYRIKLELLSKFDRESVDNFFDVICESVDFKSFALEAAQKEARRGSDVKKIAGKLQRLGHDSSAIRHALSEIRSSSDGTDN